MWNLIKRYWDLLGGFITGLALSLAANFKLERVQLIYSVIILILVCMGVFKVIKACVDKSISKRTDTEERKSNIFDMAVDSRKEMKAINMAQNPLQQGEEVANLTIETVKGVHIMNNLKKIGHIIYMILIWLKGNWENLYAAIYVTLGLVFTNLIFYMEGLHSVFGNNAIWTTNVYVKIGVLVLSILGAITTWVTTATKDKFYSFSTLIKRMEEKEKAHEEAKLNKEQQAKVKALQDKVMSRLDETIKQINDLTNKLKALELDYNTCHALVPNYNEERSNIEREIENLVPLKLELEKSVKQINNKEE